MSDVISMLDELAPVLLVILSVAVILGALDHLFEWIRYRGSDDDV